MNSIITPKENDVHVQRLLSLIDSDLELIVLEIKPEPGSEPSDCTNIVEQKVKKEGGRIIYGWQIWKTKFLVEAEFHAVWEMPDGETLVDLTPKNYKGITEILFLEDESIVYDGKQIDNIRLNITKNHLVTHFIEICKAYFAFMNKGERANQYQLILNSVEQNELYEIEKLREGVGAMLELGCNIESLCFCRSGIKYKLCHGQGLINRLRK